MTAEVMNKTLSRFYAEIRNKGGDLYSKSAYVGLRAAINRYIRNPPYHREINIITDKEFLKSNQVFKAMLRKMRQEGLDRTEHHKAMAAGDIKKIRESPCLSLDNPKSLQRKIWFEITMHFARRGCENTRFLKKTSFELKSDDIGKKYIKMTYNEATKNHPGDDSMSNPKENVTPKTRMYETQNEATCPVVAFQVYLSKLNPQCPDLFQQPKRNFQYEDATWYTSRPVGERTLNEMMKNISKDVGLNIIYTNHCVRASAITTLSHAGV